MSARGQRTYEGYILNPIQWDCLFTFRDDPHEDNHSLISENEAMPRPPDPPKAKRDDIRSHRPNSGRNRVDDHVPGWLKSKTVCHIGRVLSCSPVLAFAKS